MHPLSRGFSAVPPTLFLPSRSSWQALYEKSWELALRNVADPKKEGWRAHLTCMPGVDYVWQWDTCFMSLFARYGNGYVPNMECLDNLYRLQREDGFIAMAYCISTDQPAYGKRVNPPLYAWVEWSYFSLSGDDSRFSKVLPILVSFFDWLKANRTRTSGLYWFEDAGSSGMDNAPRSGYESAALDGSDICHIDLIAQQAMSAEFIARMSRRIGNEMLAQRMDREWADIKNLVDSYHWHEKTGFYYDLFGRTKPEERHNFVNHKTIAAFWPMIAGLCSPAQSARLVEHLLNPEEFWTEHPIASLSKDDINYDPKGGYWLGAVWAPTNYMVAKGLQRYGYHDIAGEVACRHIDAMAKVLTAPQDPGVWECYAPEGLAPSTNGYDSLCRPDFVGWSGLGPIAMLIEDVMGYEFDAANNTITLHHLQNPLENYQLENLPFNGGAVCFVVRSDVLEMSRLEVCTDRPFLLRLAGADGAFSEHEIGEGRQEIALPTISKGEL